MTSDERLRALVAKMTLWCIDNSGHYHEDDVEETVKAWADELAALLDAPREPFEDSALGVLMSDTATPVQRDAAWLRQHAKHVRMNKPWDIPNTLATTIEDIAARVEQRDASYKLPDSDGRLRAAVRQALITLEAVAGWSADDLQGLKYHVMEEARDLRHALDAPRPSNEEIEARQILTWVGMVLNGKPVPDFAESFPLVRQVQDLLFGVEPCEPRTEGR